MRNRFYNAVQHVINDFGTIVGRRTQNTSAPSSPPPVPSSCSALPLYDPRILGSSCQFLVDFKQVNRSSISPLQE